MPAFERELNRLIRSLEEAGYRVLLRAVSPHEIELIDEEPGGRYPVVLSLRLRRLRPGGHRPDGSMRAWFPRETLSRRGEPEHFGRLTLGYEPDLDVFAGWPAHDAGKAGEPRRLWVPRRALKEAASRGIAMPRRSSGAVAFRPDRVRHYLELREAWRFVEDRGGDLALGVDLGTSIFPMRRVYSEEIRMGDEASAAGDMAVTDFLAVGGGSPPPEQREAREIETGFSTPDAPGKGLRPEAPLAPATEYLYWFAIGAETGASIDTKPVSPPDDLPDGAHLTVQLFPFEDELELHGPARGEVELLPSGRARVSRPAAVASDDEELHEKLLFFSVRTPKRLGVHRLRCNLYYGSTLLQSRQVSCRVGAEAIDERPALAADLDYALSSVLDLTALANVPSHELSLMVNGSGPAASPTHQIFFFGDGEEPLVESASIGEGRIAAGIGSARGALRLASWATDAEWVDGKDAYRYEQNPGNEANFAEDLIRMAIRGHRLYTGVTRAFSGRRKALKEAMRRPGRVQVASAETGLYLPAGLFYDHHLEASPSPQNEGKFRLCEEFLAALDADAPLEDSPCFGGDCPSYEERYVVCPSGFWGYRHEIGWPVGSDEPVTKVSLDGKAEMAIGVSTDPRLMRRKEHVERVLAMGRGKVVESREEFRDLVKSVAPHLVYLYCHGGVSAAEGAPFLVLGPLESDGLDGTYLVDEEIEWGDPPPRPVVFINGCHTTALGPDQLMDLVGGFVKDANAIGVVGTEVTIFEPLACAFAEGMLGHFLDGGMTIGRAIRRARSDLLRARNPLGLVYVPFIAADTQLVRAA